MRKIIVLLMLIVIPSVVLAQTGRKVSDRTLLTSPTTDDLVDCVDTGSSTSYKCTMGGIVALADNINWSTMDTISTVNNSDKFVVNSSGTNKSINWDTFEDVITDNINWTAYENVSTLNGADSFWVNVGGTNKEINWTDLGPLTGASTWTKSGTDVYLTTTSDNVGVGTTTSTGKFHIKGAGNTSSTNSLLVENNNQDDILIIRDDGLVSIGTTYSGSTNNGLNIKGKLGVGDTLLDIATQLNLSNGNVSSTSQELVINIDGYQLSSGGTTGVSNRVTKSGTGNANDIIAFTALPRYTAGSGTQTNIYGYRTSSSSPVTSGGTVTNYYGFTNLGTTPGGTITNYYGAYFNDANSGATNNFALYVDGKSFFTNGNVGIGTVSPVASLEVNGLIVPDKVTADPCSAGTPEGGAFYNDTSNYWCYCDGTNDVKMNDPGVACF